MSALLWKYLREHLITLCMNARDLSFILHRKLADAATFAERQEEFERVLTAAKLSRKLGLGVHAGHGMDYRNVLWLRKISEIEEFSIGHAIIARAILTGIERAVQEMIALVNG